MTTIGSLFSGIAGLERGIEIAVPGAEVIWQAENDPAARAVLDRWYPGVRRYNDVREIDGRAERPDIICGGFPCQDISDAGVRVGIGGKRSGLWREFARIIRALRPRLVFVENVGSLAIRGLDVVLRDLASCGLDAEWDVVRASDVGAPHRRERLFILAYRPGEGWGRAPVAVELGGGAAALRGGAAEPDGRGEHLDLANDSGRCEGERLAQLRGLGSASGREPDGRGHERYVHRFPPGPAGIAGWDGAQPAVRGISNGLSRRMDLYVCECRKADRARTGRGGRLDADAAEAGREKALPQLRRAVASQEVGRPRDAGVEPALPAAEILRQDVRSGWIAPGDRREASPHVASSETSEGCVRELRRDDAAPGSSPRSELDEQRPEEPADALPELSSAPALGRGRSAREATAQDAGGDRRDRRVGEVVADGAAAAGKSSRTERHDRSHSGCRCICHAKDRLRLLGNACVPQQAALAFETLAARVGAP